MITIESKYSWCIHETISGSIAVLQCNPDHLWFDRNKQRDVLEKIYAYRRGKRRNKDIPLTTEEFLLLNQTMNFIYYQFWIDVRPEEYEIVTWYSLKEFQDTMKYLSSIAYELDPINLGK